MINCGSALNPKKEYLGLKLRTPLVPSASPFSESFDDIKRLEDADAAAIVLHSLFEEHITFERHQLHHHFTYGTEGYAEALTYWPEMSVLSVDPESYLDEIAAAKEATKNPIIAEPHRITSPDKSVTSRARFRICDRGIDANNLGTSLQSHQE